MEETLTVGDHAQTELRWILKREKRDRRLRNVIRFRAAIVILQARTMALIMVAGVWGIIWLINSFYNWELYDVLEFMKSIPTIQPNSRVSIMFCMIITSAVQCGVTIAISHGLFKKKRIFI